MKMGKWARLLLLAAAPTLVGFLTGCGDFWQAPGGGGGSTSFTLTNSGTITVSPGATSGNTATISVTPSNSFTGSVTLSCAVTTSPSGASNLPTCNLNPTSVTISGTTAQTSTLTAATTSATTTGTYKVMVSGVSGSVTETTTVCVEVTTSPTGNCSSNAGTSGVFYVLNQTTDQVVAMSITSGQLTSIGAVTLPSPQPLAIAVAPNGLFLYVSTATGVYLYAINSDGSLTLGNNGTAISTDPAYTMQVDATSSWLVETVSGVAQLNAIAINSSSGLLATAGESEQTVALPASTPTQLAISPNDSTSCTSCYVFVGMGASGTAVVPFNPGNASPFGTVSHFNVKNSGGDNAVAVDPNNRLLYVGESDALSSSTQSGGLRVFTIAGNGVTELTSAGSPYAVGGTGPSAILPTSDGDYVYVANGSVSGSSTGNIAGFSVSATSLTSIGTATAGASGHLSLAEDSTGSFLLAVDFAGSPDLEAYTMSSGTLTSVLTDSTGTDPVGAIAIAAAP
jgi:6-phosphogluconolactonase (cycloisomerase 2 family)